MSKILVLTVPAEGHFNPFVPIITGLVKRGHEVVCFAGSAFRHRVEKTGATFRPPPPKWDFGETEIYDFFPELRKKKGLAQLTYYFKHVMFDPVPDILSTLKNELENFHADVMISDTFMIVGSWIKELDKTPCVRISVVPLNMPGKNIPPFGFGLLPGKSFLSRWRNNLIKWIFQEFIIKDVLKYGNKIRKQAGLPVKTLFTKVYDGSDLILHTSTPAFEYPRDKYPPNFRFIGPIIIPPVKDYEKPAWWPEIEKGLPVVLINQGTVAKNYNDLIIPSISGLKDEQMVVLAVPVAKGELTNLPENAYTEPYIPFGNLLPHVDVFITNGGFGGTQNALAHGIPVIIAGATEDKMEVSARVEYAGAGINLRKHKPSPGDIRKAVRKILSDPSYRERARELQNDFAKFDAPELAVRWIEEFIEVP